MTVTLLASLVASGVHTHQFHLPRRCHAPLHMRGRYPVEVDQASSSAPPSSWMPLAGTSISRKVGWRNLSVGFPPCLCEVVAGLWDSAQPRSRHPRISVLNDGTLNFPRAALRHRVYTCMVTNVAGNPTPRPTLNVEHGRAQHLQLQLLHHGHGGDHRDLALEDTTRKYKPVPTIVHWLPAGLYSPLPRCSSRPPVCPSRWQ